MRPILHIFNNINRKFKTLTMSENVKNNQLINMAKRIVPELSNDRHKGQAGRIGVIGGSLEYTGAPYFTSISALKVGADLVHVFCRREAAAVIKSYSPELIVHPLLDVEDSVEQITPWLERLHVIVIGPGLGRDQSVFENVADIITICRKMKIPLVIDADGLFLIQHNPKLIHNYKNIILTPNKIEFDRMFGNCMTNSEVFVKTEELFGCTPVVIRKGFKDSIFDSSTKWQCDLPAGGSGRRCGGQGDLMSGALATFYCWALQAKENELNQECYESENLPAILACSAASLLTKACNEEAFRTSGRSTTCSDMIKEIHYVFSNYFEKHETD